MRASRWLAVAGVVLALFLMHGLTADHDAAMPMTATTNSATQAGGHDLAAPVTVQAQAVAGGLGSPAGVHRPSSGLTTVADVLSGTGHLPNAMAGLCVAVLGAAVLLPLLLGRRLPHRLNPLAGPRLQRTSGRAGAGGPPWLTEPSLHRLCISRT